MRGLDTAFPCVRPGLPRSASGRRQLSTTQFARGFPCRGPAPSDAQQDVLFGSEPVSCDGGAAVRDCWLTEALRFYFTTNRPQEGGHLACDRGHDYALPFAACHELAVTAAQAQLGLPGDVAHRLGQIGLPLLQQPALAGREAVGPGALDQYSPRPTVAGLRV